MDQLLDIQRAGGYPLCAETLQVLYDNARCFNTFFRGLNLPGKSFIKLGAENLQQGHEGKRYAIVSIPAGNTTMQKIVRYLTPLSDATYRKVVISEVEKSVYDSNGNEIQGVYSEETAEVVAAANEGESWKFYDLKDVIELALWEDILSSLNLQTSQTGTFTLDGTYANFMRKNERAVQMKLKISASVNGAADNLNSDGYAVSFGLPSSLNAVGCVNVVVECENKIETTHAVIKGGQMIIYVGVALKKIANTETIWHSKSWTMYVNGEVLL